MPKAEAVQFLSEGLSLRGRFRAATRGPGPAAVICHPHPQFGGSMDNNVVYALEAHLFARGISTLCFNFRGVGGSEGEYSEMRGETMDAIGALGYLASRPETDPSRIGLAGYSFGGLMAVRAASRIASLAGFEVDDPAARVPAPAALALISPMTPAGGWKRSDWNAAFYAAPPPTLLLTGTRDQFCPVNSAKDLSINLGSVCRLVFIEGVDHFYMGAEDEAGVNAADFMEGALRPKAK